MPHPSKSNVSTEKNPKQPNHGGKGTDEDEIGPSHNLWVGNLSNDTTDSDLMDIFAKYGALDSVTTYSSRNFAFIYFKRLEDARAAKEALQGTVLLGNPIKIEFARPARPGKHLWVGGISSSVTKEQLEDEFLKFGKIEEFKFLRDRNSALVDYYRMEDAAAALKNMNGKRLGGEQIRVDYLRSQPSRRENWSDFPDSRDRRSMGPPEPFLMSDGMRNHPESSQFGSKRNLPSQHPVGRRGQQPSNVLWIGYPPSVQIDEQMLHNAMILFGEIERIKSFPSRHYSFVEFRSVDEARRAKEGLQGRLFNDPRIQILFSSSGLAPGKDSPGLYPGIKGPRPDMFFSEPLFVPGSMDFYGQNRPMAPYNFQGPLASKGMPGPNMLMRSFGPQSGFDPLLSAAPELFNDLAGLLNNFSDVNNPTGPNWRRLSPSGPGMLPSPATGMRPGIRPSGTWDGSDVHAFQRESKRSRIDGPSPIDDPSLLGRRIDNQGIGTQHDRGVLGPFANAQDLSRQSPGVRGPSGGTPGQVLPDSDLCWRGVIAKGGTPVCRARCVPIGKGIDSQLPEIVNCSARTGLDMLTKHYAEASGFDIVFFLPDSEDDFASYTEFLRYLGAKNRAGVAKFDDGTTLFLVPPSEFLTKVLNISGPERLYGVVLKLPQQMPSSAPMQQQSQQPIPPSPYINRQQLLPSQNDYNLQTQKEDQVFQMDYNRLLHEDSVHHPPKQVLQHTESPSMQSASQDYASNPTSMPQAGVSLTPELIATLASLLPTNMQSSVTTSAQLPIGSSTPRPTSFPASTTLDNIMSSQGWRQDPANMTSSLHHSREEQPVHQSQQLGHQFGNQPPYLSQYPAYGNVTSGPENTAQAMHGSTQIQDSILKIPQQGAVTSRTSSNFANPSQGAHFVPQQLNQHLQFDASHNSQRSYGSSHATDATGLFRSPAFEQPKPPVTSSTQVQQLQTALSSAGQGSTDGDADKNQRYQSTLQFAANLLLQIQQQQQQGNTQAAQGPGNHQ
ncbi:RNA recognition motif domain [Macleaya cordata]|uniref:RNA recognition motif domain n=1 Tax=Macleaya cordata TaxID=56857 RepID=A0A200QE58_MACCD|nr:RNA recognition motif domain [Macleaya cordata]